MSKIDTVLFDFDGTLMDTSEVIINSWQHTFMTIKGEERDASEIIPTMGEPLKVSMERFFPDIPVDESIRIYRSYHYNNFGDMISVFPGMHDLLEYLHENNYKTAIVTSRLLGTTMQGIEAYGLEKYIDLVITADDVTMHKPHPEPIEVALKKLNKIPEQAIMIGDTMYDILCARNAGVKSVLVGWALAVGEEARRGPDAPDFIINDPKEIIDILVG